MSGGVNSSATIITLDSGSTLPTTYPYTVVIDPDLATEEIVTVTSSTGVSGQLNVTRGQDGTTAQAHSNGSVVRHMVTGRDLGEAQSHIEAVGSYSIINNGEDPGVTTTNITKTVHGIGSGEGAVVGTLKTQTLTNKTLTSPTINTPTISTPTVTNGTFSTPTISSPTVTNGTYSGGTFTAPTIGLSTGGALNLGYTSAPITAAGVNVSAAQVAVLASIGTWTSYTPTITGTGVTAGATSTGLYSQIGKTVHFKIAITYGTGSFGTGGIAVSLPSTPNTVGVGSSLSSISSSIYAGQAQIVGDATVVPYVTPATAGGASRMVTSTVPASWISSSKLYISGTYEVA